MSNRVEELETTVSELESTVRGLTDELVETKERLRALELELGVDAADLVEGSTDDSGSSEVEAVEGDKADDADGKDESDAGDGLGDDIIVA